MSLVDSVNLMNEDQLKTVIGIGQYLQENMPKMCTCSIECYKTCKLFAELNQAIQEAGKRLESLKGRKVD